MDLAKRAIERLLGVDQARLNLEQKHIALTHRQRATRHQTEQQLCACHGQPGEAEQADDRDHQELIAHYATTCTIPTAAFATPTASLACSPVTPYTTAACCISSLLAFPWPVRARL